MTSQLSDSEKNELRELVLERAAIKEFDGGISREQAEREARDEIFGELKAEGE